MVRRTHAGFGVEPILSPTLKSRWRRSLYLLPMAWSKACLIVLTSVTEYLFFLTVAVEGHLPPLYIPHHGCHRCSTRTAPLSEGRAALYPGTLGWQRFFTSCTPIRVPDLLLGSPVHFLVKSTFSKNFTKPFSSEPPASSSAHPGYQSRSLALRHSQAITDQSPWTASAGIVLGWFSQNPLYSS